MKKFALSTLVTILLITSCQEQPEESDTTIPSDKELADVIKFEVANQKIGQFLDQLNSSQTSMAEHQQIICKDYPTIYFDEYVPALMKLSPKYSMDQLKQDLGVALDLYKEKDQVSC